MQSDLEVSKGPENPTRIQPPVQAMIAEETNVSPQSYTRRYEHFDREIHASVVGEAPATEGSAVFRPENLNTFDGYN